MHKIVRKLTADMPENGRVVAICGRNERLLETLSEEKDLRLTALGYTTNVDEYMDAADFIITKPGGLSSTEAANKHLPMVFINAVGGCEGRNFDFFLKSGFAVGSEDADEVVTMATSLAHDPERLETMRQNLSKAFTTNSAAEIAACVTRAAENYRGIKKEALPAETPAPAPEAGTAPAPEKKTAANLARAILGSPRPGPDIPSMRVSPGRKGTNGWPGFLRKLPPTKRSTPSVSCGNCVRLAFRGPSRT